MAGLGISRVTDITRLDRLGLSVHASVRPRGRSLCVHAGKGMRPEESRVGALMEAVELALAELDGERLSGAEFKRDQARANRRVGGGPDKAGAGALLRRPKHLGKKVLQHLAAVFVLVEVEAAPKLRGQLPGIKRVLDG